MSHILQGEYSQEIFDRNLKIYISYLKGETFTSISRRLPITRERCAEVIRKMMRRQRKLENSICLSKRKKIYIFNIFLGMHLQSLNLLKEN